MALRWRRYVGFLHLNLNFGNVARNCNIKGMSIGGHTLQALKTDSGIAIARLCFGCTDNKTKVCSGISSSGEWRLGPWRVLHVISFKFLGYFKHEFTAEKRTKLTRSPEKLP